MIKVVQVFKDKALAAAGGVDAATSEPILMERGSNFAVEVVTATGSAQDWDIDYTVCSDKDGTFVTPGAGGNIVTAGDGTDCKSFTPVTNKWIKLVISNDSSHAGGVTLSVNLIIQED
jgi:hypothetical protein